MTESVTVEELERDPYPVYARLRREAPIAWVPSVGLWFVTRWQDLVEAAEDPARFPAGFAGSPLDRTCGGATVLTVDGNEQEHWREPMERTLRPRRIEQTAPDVVAAIATELLDGLAAEGTADLMDAYCEPLAVLSLARVIGLPEHLDAPTLRRWFHDIAGGTSNYENDPEKQSIADATAAEVDAVLRPRLARLLAEPDDSMLSEMLHAEDGDLDTRMRGFLPTLKVALIGGLQEPAHGLGSTVVGLLEHPDQLAAVRADPQTLVRRAVDEGLRWVSPIGTQGRVAGREATVAGITIPPGEGVGLMIPSANRDETVWGDAADVFDIERPKHANAAFGFGPHFCVGHQLARIQMRTGLSLLLERFPRLRLDPDHAPVFRGWEYRGPATLSVRW
ncbi:MAG: cytochrome P450 [Actinomycetota bacterium]